MKGAAIYGERSLFHHFAEPRMAVTDARNIFSSPAKLHSNNAILNKIASRRANGMDTYNSIGLGVGENFDEAIRLSHGTGTGIRIRTAAEGAAALPEFRLLGSHLAGSVVASATAGARTRASCSRRCR